jgi:hypothetical protein
MQEWYQKRFQKTKKVSHGPTFYLSIDGGADRDRTDDLMAARRIPLIGVSAKYHYLFEILIFENSKLCKKCT